MDVFGIGILELIFILIIAMIVVGPRDLGKVGRQVGRFLNRMYRSESWRMLNEASRTLRNLPNRLAREAALEELDSVQESLKETGRMIQREAKDVDSALNAWTPTNLEALDPGSQASAEASESQDQDPE